MNGMNGIYILFIWFIGFILVNHCLETRMATRKPMLCGGS